MTKRIRKVLLVSSNKTTNPYPVYPLGLSFLHAALEEHSYEVRLWDCLVHKEALLDEYLEWAEAIGISLRNVDNVSFKSPVDFTEEHASLVIRIRDKSDAPIIIGGSAFSIFPVQFMDRLKVNWGIQGEAEIALPALFRAWNQKRSYHDIPSLVFRDESGRVRTNPTGMISGDQIPSPRHDPALIRAYLELGGMLNVQTQRGCPLKCTYCTYPWIEGRRYRHRKASDVVDEMRHIQKHGGRYIFFTDSVFNTTRRHVESICQSIIDSGLKMEWGCFARPKALDDKLLDLMVEAGLKHLEFGSDSFSPTTLKTYGKSFSFSEIQEASKVAARKKIHTCHYIIFGGPGETKETILETVKNSLALPSAPIFAFSGMRIYPHTPLANLTENREEKALTKPVFFTPAPLGDAERERIIRDATKDLPNWFLSDHADDNAEFTKKLRKKGKEGPLWEYLSISRRLQHIA
jgi:radical SAM superfamily enzyme YgiQ (UPF0313 family)